MDIKNSYNDGKVHLDFFNKSIFEKEQIATEFAEGNDSLKNTLLTSWNLGFMTSACCAGHEDTFDGKMLCINVETGLPEKVDVTADQAKLTYISFILDKNSYQYLGSLCTALFSKFKDNISCSVAFSSISQANFSFHCAPSLKNEFFNFISDFLKTKTTLYCNDAAKLCVYLEEILPKYLNDNSYTFFSNNLKVHKSIYSANFEWNNGSVDTSFSYNFFNEENYIFLDVVRKDGLLLKYVPTNLTNYSTIAFEAVKQNTNAFGYVVPDKVDNYFDLVSFAVKRDSISILFVPGEIKDYSDIIYSAVKQNLDCFRFVDANMVNNYFEISLFAVKNNGLLLKYVPSDFDNYSTIAFVAVKQNYNAFMFVDSKVDNYFEIALCAVNQNGLLLESIPSGFEGYSNIAFEAIKQNPQAFKFISIFSVYDYYEIALFALEKDCSLIKFVPTDYSNYNKLVLKVAVKNPEILRFIDYNNSVIKDIIYPVLYENGHADMYIPNQIIKSKNFKINFMTYSCRKKIQDFNLKLQCEKVFNDVKKSNKKM